MTTDWNVSFFAYKFNKLDLDGRGNPVTLFTQKHIQKQKTEPRAEKMKQYCKTALN